MVPLFLFRSLRGVPRWPKERQIMKKLRIFALLLLVMPLLVSAQKLEVGGGSTHTSGDGALDGFNIGAATWIPNRVSLAVNYDTGWDNSHLGVFELPQTGAVFA